MIFKGNSKTLGYYYVKLLALSVVLFGKHVPVVAKRLTPEKLRSYPGLEHYTDEEAEEIIDQLERLSYILVSMALEKQKKAVLYIRSDSNDSANRQKEILTQYLGGTGIEPVYVVEGKGNKGGSAENQRDSTEQDSN